MLLLVDIGNTRTKYCSIKEADVSSHQFSHVHYCDNQALSHQWLDSHWHQATQIVFASVAEQRFTHLLDSWATQHNIPCQQARSANHAFGVTSGYQTPEQLGVDRWLALLGAKKLYPNKACLIIDAGTATTVDYLDETGQHHGGWILAGIHTLFTSIQTNTANVLGQQADINDLTFGKNTNDNLANAAWGATVGLIEHAKALVKTKNLNLDEVIITGGNGAKLAKYLADGESIQPSLVFHGLSCFIADAH